MATIHVIGKLDLIILVSDSRIVQVTKNVFYAMFVFQWGSLHVYKDVSYAEDNIVLSYVYQVLTVNFKWMFWIVPNGKYWIIIDHVFNNSHDIVLTLGTNASVVNIIAKNIMKKEEPNLVSHDSKFYILMAKSSFINLCDYSNKDSPSLHNVVVSVFMNF